MKQLLTFTGGHQRTVDDLVHIQAGALESLIAIAKGLTTNGATIPNCILFGCEFTVYPPTTIADISAGALILDGEICYFPGIVGIDLDVAPDLLVFSPLDTYPATNPVGYADGSTHNVHLDRIVEILQISGSPAANQAIMAAPLFLDVLRTNLSTPGAWRQVGTTGNPAAPGWSWYDTSSKMYFRKNLLGNTLEVRGEIKIINSSGIGDPPINYSLWTMPAGYLPAYHISFVGTITKHLAPFDTNSNSDVIKNANMSVDTSGNVSINPESVPANTNFSIRFYAIFSLS